MKAHSRIATLLKQTTGLDIATVGRTAFDSAIRSRMTCCGACDSESYWERLQTSGAELQELIEAVVVPETWFFRDREAFNMLRKTVRNEWLPAHPTRPLRALSLPCSSGEEPYSIAMLLLDAGLSRDRFNVDAMDISIRALALARRAVYGRNSFRSRDLAFRDHYFRPMENDYELAPEVRECVRFHQANILAADLFAGARPYDVVFCRNVLIYFDAPTQKRVIAVLTRLLGSNGLLFVGPAEAFLVRRSGLDSAGDASAFAYRKPRAPAPVPPRRETRPAEARIVTPLSRNERQPRPLSAEKVTGDLSYATGLADAGRLIEAAEVCEAYLRDEGASASAYYLLGLVRNATGDERQAIDCYRKTIYLDPNHSEALIHLALLTEKQGDAATARRLRLRARRIEEGSGR